MINQYLIYSYGKCFILQIQFHFVVLIEKTRVYHMINWSNKNKWTREKICMNGQSKIHKKPTSQKPFRKLLHIEKQEILQTFDKKTQLFVSIILWLLLIFSLNFYYMKQLFCYGVNQCFPTFFSSRTPLQNSSTYKVTLLHIPRTPRGSRTTGWESLL